MAINNTWGSAQLPAGYVPPTDFPRVSRPIDPNPQPQSALVNSALNNGVLGFMNSQNPSGAGFMPMGSNNMTGAIPTTPQPNSNPSNGFAGMFGGVSGLSPLGQFIPNGFQNMNGGAPGGMSNTLAAGQNFMNSINPPGTVDPSLNAVPQGGYGYGSVSNPQNTAPTPVGGMSNQNNFNFSPTPLDASGSYNTEDWATLLGGLATGGLAGAASSAGINNAVARLQALGQAGLQDYTNLAKTATEGIKFNPYALTSALGTTRETAPGVISQTLTPQQQANVDRAQALQGQLYGAALPDTSGIAQGAFSGAQAGVGQVGAGQEDLAALRAGYGTAAQGMTGMLGGSTTDMANKLFEQQQAMRTPAQQRQALELENRLRAQGRLGTTTAAYGGTPEQLAMAKAVQEQQAADAFNSMTQAEQMATSQQARALGLGSATSTMAQAQQALRQGDINAAQGLFNLGSAAAQLPQQMRGQDIAQAGQLQGQALAPAAQQLLQAQQAGTMGQQRGDLAAKAGGLFAGTVGAGLQERLTAESAAAATRTKQYTAALQTLANQGGQTGTAANTIQQAINSGIQNIGGKLYNAAGGLIGDVAEVFGNSVSDLWNSLTNAYPAGNNPDEVVTNIGSDIVNEIGDIISGGGDAIKKAWNSIFG